MIKGFISKQQKTKLNSCKPYILILGGYGYGNVGDEAQLSANIEQIASTCSDYDAIVLTPDLEYTQKNHDCYVSYAPRVAFFDHDIAKYYWLNSKKDKRKFIFKALVIYLIALLVKIKLQFLPVSRKRLDLIYLLVNSKMVFFSGGGYLTGKTLSRLWDGILFVLLAKLFDLPVIMSGQTIGLFRSRFDRFFSSIAFKYVRIITVRDKHESLEALEGIGVSGKHVYAICDDALFCKKSDSGFNNDEKYIAFQFHFWGVISENAQADLMENVRNLILNLQSNYDYKVVLFGMVDSDYEILEKFMITYAFSNVESFNSGGDFRKIKGFLSKAEICITMKHHPIIFALGERVPVVSLSYDSYYVHKNGGALSIFNLQRFNIDITDHFDIKLILQKIEEAITNKNQISEDLTPMLENLKRKRDIFFTEIKNVLDESRARDLL